MCHLLRRPPVKEEVVIKNKTPYEQHIRSYTTNHALSSLPMIQVPLRRQPINEAVLDRAGSRARHFCDLLTELPEVTDIITLFDNGFMLRTPLDIDVPTFERGLTSALQTAYGFQNVTMSSGGAR